jgi:hypothetical protein
VSGATFEKMQLDTFAVDDTIHSPPPFTNVDPCTTADDCGAPIASTLVGMPGIATNRQLSTLT